MAATVGDYMVRDVQYVGPEMTVEEVKEKLINSNFHGFPVVENGYLLGYVTAKELLRYMETPKAKLRSVISRGTLCVIPSMSIDDATRVLFRYGLRNLPVVDEEKRLVGIISNIDIVRSQIEKSRPGKVMNVKNFMEQQNGIKMRIYNRDIPIDQMIPTQKEVYMDELVGRQYEIKRGLNEPLIVIKRHNGYLIVDGHHRIMAAKRLGMKTFKCIVLEPNNLDVPLGLETTAERWGLHTLDDVKIIEGSKHPFMEVTTMLLPKEQAENINQILMERMEEDPGPGVPSPIPPRKPIAKKNEKTQKAAHDEAKPPRKKASKPASGKTSKKKAPASKKKAKA
jgi:CBS domain-containing protein